MADNKFTNGAGGNTWNTAGNWSLGVVPTGSDGHVVIFDATSPNCSMGAARTCNSINFTGYTGTFTMSTFTLTVTNNVTLDTGFIISGTGTLTQTSTGTLTSNGRSWPNQLVLSGAATRTLFGNDFVVLGLVSNGAGNTVINKTTTEKFICPGFSYNGNVSGTATIQLTGGGSNSTTGGFMSNNIEFNGSVTVTSLIVQTTTLTYIGGSIANLGGTVTVLSTPNTINCVGMYFNNLVFSTGGTAATITLSSQLNVLGVLSYTTTAGTEFTMSGGYGFVCGVLSYAVTSNFITTIILQQNITYRITSGLSIYLTTFSGAPYITSSSGKAKLILDWGAYCRSRARFTNIDASEGRPIRTFNGTVSNCDNIVSFYDLKTVSAAA